MSDVATLQAEKQAATALLQAGQLTKARDAYFSVLIKIDSEETRTPDPSKIEIKVACLNNLMALFLKTKKYKEVVELSRQVLQIEPNNVKALFRQSQAFVAVDMNNDAILSLRQLLVVEPENAQAKELLFKVMDKLNPLESEEDNLPPPPPKTGWDSMDSDDKRRPEEGKVYNISKMPVEQSSSTSSTASSMTESEKPVKDPLVFGAGWDFMNPQWSPGTDSNEDQESKTNNEEEMKAQSSKDNLPSEGHSRLTKDVDDSAKIFLDEAERARIKNQLFAEAIKKTTVSDTTSSAKLKNKGKSSSSRQRDVEVDEIVSKTVEELSIEEKSLVAKVESKKAKSSKGKMKKSGGSGSTSASAGTLKKKAVLSSKAKR